MNEITEEKRKQAKEAIEKKLDLPRFSYDNSYKLLMIIPLAILLFSFAYLLFFYIETGEFMYKDVTLTGGTTLTIYSENLSLAKLEPLKEKFDDVMLRTITDLRTGRQIALTVEAAVDSAELKKETEDILGYELTDRNSSTEFTGASLSKSFYRELLTALAIAFIFMAIVVFIIFRSPLPSSYVLLSALMDIIVPLTIVNLAGIRLSTAGIAAFLMLIGYSVDTDILLTTKVLRRRENALNTRIFSALKTGLTMTLTSLVAVLIAYFIATSPIFKQVFLILSIGLAVDLISTWCMNASLLKWWCERKGIR